MLLGRPKVNYRAMHEEEAAEYLLAVKPVHVSRIDSGTYKHYSALLNDNSFIRGDVEGFVIYHSDGTPMTVVQIRRPA